MNSPPINTDKTEAGKNVATGNNDGLRACLQINLLCDAPFNLANLACCDSISSFIEVLIYFIYAIDEGRAKAIEGIIQVIRFEAE
ncbi:MAG: hypothetical protein DSZ21_01600 [Tenericutes bacterium]|nr:MAG: hypothetical protein DSZ21_01600 [Mycoplasmatota bacterium]